MSSALAQEWVAGKQYKGEKEACSSLSALVAFALNLSHELLPYAIYHSVLELAEYGLKPLPTVI